MNKRKVIQIMLKTACNVCGCIDFLKDNSIDVTKVCFGDSIEDMLDRENIS